MKQYRITFKNKSGEIYDRRVTMVSHPRHAQLLNADIKYCREQGDVVDIQIRDVSPWEPAAEVVSE